VVDCSACDPNVPNESTGNAPRSGVNVTGSSSALVFADGNSSALSNGPGGSTGAVMDEITVTEEINIRRYGR